MGPLEIETEGLCGAAALNRRECLQVGGSRLRRESAGARELCSTDEETCESSTIVELKPPGRGAVVAVE